MPAVAANAAPAPVTGGGRYPGLDGLRGLAAVVVLTMHCMLVSPVLALAFYGAPTPDTLTWWWVHSFPHLLWAGGEAVTVFFVLSGFVLTLPYLRAHGRPSWRAYYPQRLLRLYLPVAASLLLAAGGHLVVEHRAEPGMSWWLQGHAVPVTPAALAHDGVLLLGVGWLNSVLWSLRWEVLFSLALPAVVWLVVRAGRWRPLLLALTVLTIGVVAVLGIPGTVFLPMFGVGALMAAERARLATLATRLGPGGWAAVLLVAVTALLVKWWPGVHLESSPAFVTVGAALLVAAFMWCPAAVALGRRRCVQWLGVRSFSLYLIHDPIVTGTAFLLRTDHPLVVLAVAAPVALLVTAAFYRLVERPSHRLAKRAGRWAASRSLIAGRRGSRASTPGIRADPRS